MKAYDRQFIGGKWREGRGAGRLEDRDPLSGRLLYDYAPASAADADEAYTAARAAQKSWERVPPAEKTLLFENLFRVFQEYLPVIDECLILEGGSTKPKREFETTVGPAFIRGAMAMPAMLEGKIMASDMPQTNFVFRRAKGVVTVIAPWNVPFVLSLRSVAPALAAGNAVVLKPASDTPASAFILAEMIEKAGFPAGVFSALAGRGSDIGDYLVTHPASDMVSFTGSTAVGRRIGALAGGAVKDAALELGGNNSMLVLSDADVDAAVGAAVFGAYFHQGQICMALNRIIIDDSRYDEFAEKFTAAVSALKCGDPADPEVFVGPIINGAQADSVMGFVQSTVGAGAKVLVQGGREGNLIRPWLFGDVTNDMPAAKNEVFGPVCCLLRARDENQAVSMANDTEYGLSNSVFTRDRYRGMEVARRLESGMVHVNDQSIGDEPHVMFGGEKQSGIGRFNGRWAIEKFTTEQWIPVR